MPEDATAAETSAPAPDLELGPNDHAMAAYDAAVSPVLSRLGGIGLVTYHEVGSLASAMRSGVSAALGVLVNGPPAAASVDPAAEAAEIATGEDAGFDSAAGA